MSKTIAHFKGEMKNTMPHHEDIVDKNIKTECVIKNDANLIFTLYTGKNKIIVDVKADSHLNIRLVRGKTKAPKPPKPYRPVNY